MKASWRRRAVASLTLPVRNSWWVASGLVSLLLLTIIVTQWVGAHRTPAPQTVQLVDNDALVEVLGETDRWDEPDPMKRGRGKHRQTGEDRVRVPTGVFIESLRFEDEKDVHMTGYIWQQFAGEHCRYDAEAVSSRVRLPVAVDEDPTTVEPIRQPTLADFGQSCAVILREAAAAGEAVVTEPVPQPDEGPGADATPSEQDSAMVLPGVLLPEQVDASGPPTLAYVEYNAARGTTAIGWYFDATIRQPFEFGDYPFDHKTVWLTIWPRDFTTNVVLVPDFGGYPCEQGAAVGCTSETDIFGISTEIVLNEFAREDTYFDYALEDFHNSNFGIETFQERLYPELQFNVVVRRNASSALLANLVPLIVAAGIGFAMVMTVTTRSDAAAVFGYSTSRLLTTVSITFLAVLIAHQRLRLRFEGLVYLEYLYFVLYVALLGVASVSLLASSPSARERFGIRFGDVLLPQVAYWPTILGAVAVLTAIRF